MAYSVKTWLLFAIIFTTIAMVSADSSDHDFESNGDHDEEHSSDEAHSSDEDHESHDHDEHEEYDKSTGRMLEALAITTASGCAALLGFCFIFCLKKDQTAFIPISLGFSGGIVVYLVFMNLIPEGKEQLFHSMNEESETMAHIYNALCIFGGLMMSLSMERLIPHSHADEHPAAKAASPRKVQMAELQVEEQHISKNYQLSDQEVRASHSPHSQNPLDIETVLERQSTLPRVSYSVAAALILHHLPEGIAVFISLYHDMNFGIVVALALAIHDFPSGVCIALPIFLTTGSKLMPFLLCLLAAFAYFLGGILGWVIIAAATDQFADAFTGVLFGLTSGVMLYVAFVEILPAAITAANDHQDSTALPGAENGHKHHHNRVYVGTILSIFAGFLIMDISNILLMECGGHSH